MYFAQCESCPLLHAEVAASGISLHECCLRPGSLSGENVAPPSDQTSAWEWRPFFLSSPAIVERMAVLEKYGFLFIVIIGSRYFR